MYAKDLSQRTDVVESEKKQADHDLENDASKFDASFTSCCAKLLTRLRAGEHKSRQLNTVNTFHTAMPTSRSPMKQKRNHPEVDDEVSDSFHSSQTTSERFIDPPRSTNARCEAFILAVRELLIRCCFRQAERRW
jgi:hypothetical protein